MSLAVALVLDPNFGVQITSLSQTIPLWILSSAVNDQVVKELRQSAHSTNITILEKFGSESAVNTMIRALYDIDEHHGEASQSDPYDTLFVYGETELVCHAVFSELGFKSFTDTADGFIAYKQRAKRG